MQYADAEKTTFTANGKRTTSRRDCQIGKGQERAAC